METMEMPTQMTNNVPTTVGGFGNSISENSQVSFESPTFKTPDMLTHGVDNIYAPDVSVKTTSGVEEREVASETKNKSMSDMLLESAKDEGFEKALQKMADGDFIEEEIEDENSEVKENPEVKPDVADELAEDQLDSENPDGKEKTDSDKKEDAEIMTLHDRIAELESKFNDLSEENKQILERAKSAELQNEKLQEIVLLLAQAMYELAKQEEDEEKKVSILEILVKMMTVFMQETFTEYHEEKKPEQTAQNAPAKKSKKEDVEKLRELFRELKAEQSPVVVPTKQPSQR